MGLGVIASLFKELHGILLVEAVPEFPPRVALPDRRMKKPPVGERGGFA